LAHAAVPAALSLSLHDALPIYRDDHLLDLAPGAGPAIRDGPHAEVVRARLAHRRRPRRAAPLEDGLRLGEVWRRGTLQHVLEHLDRKSTRLNSSHVKISYACFC